MTTGGLESMLDMLADLRSGASFSSEQRDETESAASQRPSLEVARLVSMTTDSVDSPCVPYDTRAQRAERMLRCGTLRSQIGEAFDVPL